MILLYYYMVTILLLYYYDYTTHIRRGGLRHLRGDGERTEVERFEGAGRVAGSGSAPARQLACRGGSLRSLRSIRSIRSLRAHGADPIGERLAVRDLAEDWPHGRRELALVWHAHEQRQPRRAQRRTSRHLFKRSIEQAC